MQHTQPHRFDLNHQQWLKTVPDTLLEFVPATITNWNAQSDFFNQWSDLGWDERDSLLREQAAIAAD